MSHNSETPHFDIPFRWTHTGRVLEDGTPEIAAATVDQDSSDDIRNQVFSVVATPIGFRDELPEFGIASPLFGQAPLDAKRIEDAIAEWVPGANADVTEQGDPFEEAKRLIGVHLHPEEQN